MLLLSFGARVGRYRVCSTALSSASYKSLIDKIHAPSPFHRPAVSLRPQDSEIKSGVEDALKQHPPFGRTAAGVRPAPDACVFACGAPCPLGEAVVYQQEEDSSFSLPGNHRSCRKPSGLDPPGAEGGQGRCLSRRVCGSVSVSICRCLCRRRGR